MSERGEPSIAFVASEAPVAQAARADLARRYGDLSVRDADVIVALGGDGFMLQTLHEQIEAGGGAPPKPVYGMHRGSVGFLMNAYDVVDLPQRVAAAELTEVAPLRMRARRVDGRTITALAFNEVSLLRQTRQAAKLRIIIDGQARMAELICDGAMVSTPAGSTAYNLSAHGPILPLGSELLALTPISAFRPRRWRGALLPRGAQVAFEILEPEKRPVSAVADFHEARDVGLVEVAWALDSPTTLLFDPDHSLDERLIREQFLT